MKDDPSAQVDAADGKITLSAPREELILNFPAVEVQLNFKKKLELFVEPTMQREILFYFLSWALSTGKMSFMTNVKGVTEIKLTVYDTNAENDNAVISEIRVPSKWKFNMFVNFSFSNLIGMEISK